MEMASPAGAAAAARQPRGRSARQECHDHTQDRPNGTNCPVHPCSIHHSHHVESSRGSVYAVAGELAASTTSNTFHTGTRPSTQDNPLGPEAIPLTSANVGVTKFPADTTLRRTRDVAPVPYVEASRRTH
jgi:hypothetical protein